MRIIRTVAAFTDHDYYGHPIEVSAVTLYCDEAMTAEQIAVAKSNQEKRLRSMAKRMPHRFCAEFAAKQK